MKKIAFLIFILAVVGLSALFAIKALSGDDSWICQDGRWVKRGNPTETKISSVCGETAYFSGKIVDINIAGRNILLNKDGEEIEVVFFDDTVFIDDVGHAIDIHSLYRKFEISGEGSKAGENSFNARKINISKMPNIVIVKPGEDEAVALPVLIEGVARVFENTLNVRIIDSEDNILNDISTYANSPDMGYFGPFSVSLNFSTPKTDDGFIQAFNYSAKDGSIENLTSIPVRFEKVDSTNIKVYFSNSKEDPESKYCEKTYAVEKRVAKTEAIAMSAVKELLTGPNLADMSNGFFSSIQNPFDIKINSLVIKDGVARVDFNDALNKNNGGSCRVTAIRSQIENTLKQFTTVKSVIISVEGNSEEALQP